jgi:hypothetical protein
MSPVLALPECSIPRAVPVVETKTRRPLLRGGGLVATSYKYGLAVMILAIFANVNLIRLRAQQHPSTEEVSR